MHLHMRICTWQRKTEHEIYYMHQPRHWHRDLKKRPGVNFFAKARSGGLTTCNLHNQKSIQIVILHHLCPQIPHPDASQIALTCTIPDPHIDRDPPFDHFKYLHQNRLI